MYATETLLLGGVMTDSCSSACRSTAFVTLPHAVILAATCGVLPTSVKYTNSCWHGSEA